MPDPRKKGKRVEYLIRDLLRQIGECERVPCSGNARAFKGDLILSINGQTFKIEVKARKKFPASEWFKNADLLIVKPDRKAPIVLLPLDTFFTLFKNIEKF